MPYTQDRRDALLVHVQLPIAGVRGEECGVRCKVYGVRCSQDVCTHALTEACQWLPKPRHDSAWGGEGSRHCC